ncbi:hypothetical protein PI95_034315 [Hassallia byssoidea VB512170]|uniref:Serpin domain-containing protein n=1 Tax=Hassallia byssoidea VB512170 TaxID=1304833 RepID=A0A846HJ78_9CYAN|nr:hypothetical protein [Hassalia byssoidea]NEU77405.1 hypothetical protein [Hassalia byssoidea VB512170]
MLGLTGRQDFKFPACATTLTLAAIIFEHIMRIFPAAFILTLFFLTSCKNLKEHEWSALPEVTKISELQQTEFVPTLESPINGNKNVVYATAFLFAWDKVKQELKLPIALTDRNSDEFKLVNQSASYKNTMTDNEYSAEVETVDDVIIARAFFNKTLPFPSRLQKIEKPILFNNTNVLAFGIQSYDEEAAKFTEIVYYKNDDNFILKLTPKDKEHQILLAKGLDKVANLMAAVEQTKKLTNAGSKERTSPKVAWKYVLNDIDIFSIPTIKFNIEANYSDIEGQTFTTKGNLHHVEVAYQRTGFILNENGAVVESEASFALDSASAEPVKIVPKKMLFDKPFFVIIKRANSNNPYFVMYVQNTELLTKE